MVEETKAEYGHNFRQSYEADMKRLVNELVERLHVNYYSMFVQGSDRITATQHIIDALTSITGQMWGWYAVTDGDACGWEVVHDALLALNTPEMQHAMRARLMGAEEGAEAVIPHR